jgi:hypothetical protein
VNITVALTNPRGRVVTFFYAEIGQTRRFLESSCCPRPGVPSSAESTGEIGADIAEDFDLGGRGHRASPEEAGGPSAAGKVKNRMS